jgi:hypothetical protein
MTEAVRKMQQEGSHTEESGEEGIVGNRWVD